jgi:hypothetical protein
MLSLYSGPYIGQTPNEELLQIALDFYPDPYGQSGDLLFSFYFVHFQRSFKN